MTVVFSFGPVWMNENMDQASKVRAAASPKSQRLDDDAGAEAPIEETETDNWYLFRQNVKTTEAGEPRSQIVLRLRLFVGPGTAG
jgi:hypothetical protein